VVGNDCGNDRRRPIHSNDTLHQAGFEDGDAAHAYQALLFYTLGHAMLEAPHAALDPAQAAAELTASRLMYQALPADDYPNTAAVALHLYGSLEEQFAYGLDRLLDGLDPARDPLSFPAIPGQRRSGPAAAQEEGRRQNEREP
jgi:Tetracyclin repressor-like, C-terminal domain